MLEIMTTGAKKSFNPSSPPTLGYNFDKALSTSSPLATTYSGGTIETIGANAPLSGYTKTLRALNTPVNLGPASALTDLGYSDFTIEFWYYAAQIKANYQALFQATFANNLAITIQYGDVGFGYRLQFLMNPTNNANVYNTNLDRSNSLTAWRHVAFVRKDRLCYVYINGVLQTLAQAATTNYNTTQFNGNYLLSGTPATLAFSGVYGSGTSDLYTPEIAFYKGAKYTSNFTPKRPIVS